MILPLNNAKITSPYGVERTIDGVKSTHKGIDLISTTGDTQVKAIADGVIRGNFYDPDGFGNYVSIEHQDGKRSIYAHLSSYSKKAGDLVKAGDVIGIMGSTGRSTGPHVHLEIRVSPYLQHHRINVADYLGIKNDYGVVAVKELTREEKIQLIKDKIGYDDNTCKYMFEFYKYGNEALDKLVKALGV